MSHFYGYLQGARGQTTRTGSKSSGIRARIKSWTHDVNISLEADENGEDMLRVSVPERLPCSINGCALGFYRSNGKIEPVITDTVEILRLLPIRFKKAKKGVHFPMKEYTALMNAIDVALSIEKCNGR